MRLLVQVRLTAGEIELNEMDYYHSCREKKEAEKAAMEGGEVKEGEGEIKEVKVAKKTRKKKTQTEQVQNDLD